MCKTKVQSKSTESNSDLLFFLRGKVSQRVEPSRNQPLDPNPVAATFGTKLQTTVAGDFDLDGSSNVRAREGPILNWSSLFVPMGH